MLFHAAIAFAFATQASAFYFFPVHKAGVDPSARYVSSGGQISLGREQARDRIYWQRPPMVTQRATPYAPPHAEDLVKPLLRNVSTERMHEDLSGLTSILTRHSKTKTGRESQVWLLNKINEIADGYSNASNGPLVTVSEFKHSEWTQRSIIARIHGSNTSFDQSIVILGAHLDSINGQDPSSHSPGADDDGSGTVTLLETFRVLSLAGYAPTKTVEFHWYAAEEGGGLGSQDVALSYKQDKKEVAAMMQYDMTAWVRNGTDEAIGVISSDVDLGLMALHVQLVNAYSDLPAVVFRLFEGAGSDHMSWHWNGYPASCLTEGLFENMSPYIHTENDRMDISSEFSFEHMRRFVQHAIAFVIELGGGKHMLQS